MKPKTKKAAKFSQPKSRSSALDNVQTSYDDPLAVNFKALKEGEGIVVRILSLSAEDGHMAVQSCVRASVKSAKHRDKPPIQLLVPLPEDEEDAEKIKDDEGVPLADGTPQSVWYIPVYTLYKVDKDGLVSEEVNELQYLKAGPGMIKSIKKLSENFKDGYDFEGVPSYDIRIEAVANSGISNWQLHPVRSILTKPKTGKPVRETCPRFGVDDLAEALGEDAWNYVVDNIQELIDHCFEIIEKEQAVNSIKKKFLRYRQDEATQVGAKSRSVGMSRDLPGSEDGEEEENDNNEEEGEAEEESTPKFRGLAGRFKSK